VGNSFSNANAVFYHPDAPIMTGQVNLYNIYLGFGPNFTPTMTLLDFFAANIGGSAWGNVLTEYYQIVGGKKTFASNQIKLVQTVISTSTVTTFTRNIVLGIIVEMLNKRQLPMDNNGIYTIIFNGALSVSLGTNIAWLSDWCGVHGNLVLKGNNGATFDLNFALVGDPSTAPVFPDKTCMPLPAGKATANGIVGADSMVSSYAHEIVELITDNKGAWKTADGWEMADLCLWYYGSLTNGNSNVVIGGKKFLVQQIWSIGKGQCVLSL
jgi:hypothetical protein